MSGSSPSDVAVFMHRALAPKINFSWLTQKFVGKEGNLNKLAQEIHHERAHRILSCCALNSSTRQLHEVALPVWAQLHELQES